VSTKPRSSSLTTVFKRLLADSDFTCFSGSSSSGGAPSHLTSTFVDKMLRTGNLQNHIQQTLIPTYRTRYYAMMQAIQDTLIPLGVTIESNVQNGTAGGFFLYIRMPSDMPPAKVVAAVALQDHNLRVAFGHMFTVAGNPESMARLEIPGGMSQCIRLCWAWHEDGEIREGVERLGRAIASVKEKQAAGDDFKQFSKIGIR
jgi:DNA-binding transcriptional MocR family regulator